MVLTALRKRHDPSLLPARPGPDLAHCILLLHMPIVVNQRSGLPDADYTRAPVRRAPMAHSGEQSSERDMRSVEINE